MKYILCLVFLTLSCKNQNKPKYDLTIPREKMIALMVDLTVADAAAQSLTGEMRDSVVHYYKHLIEQIHGMKMADIEKNLQLLYANPALNGEIQKSLVDSIKLIDERWKQQILK